MDRTLCRIPVNLFSTICYRIGRVPRTSLLSVRRMNRRKIMKIRTLEEEVDRSSWLSLRDAISEGTNV